MTLFVFSTAVGLHLRGAPENSRYRPGGDSDGGPEAGAGDLKANDGEGPLTLELRSFRFRFAEPCQTQRRSITFEASHLCLLQETANREVRIRRASGYNEYVRLRHLINVWIAHSV